MPMTTQRESAAAVALFVVFLVLAAGDSLAQLGDSSCGILGSSCRVVTDSDVDGDICDDFQAASNILLDPSQSGGIPPRIHFAAPPRGTYDCSQRVRICLSTATTSGTTVPACDDNGSGAMPEVVGLGDWGAVLIQASELWEPNAEAPDAMIWIGDLWNDEQGIVKVNWPSLLWAQPGGQASSSFFNPFNRVLPVFCDGCTGVIGYKDRSPSDQNANAVLQGSAFVGRDLSVSVDVEANDNWGEYAVRLLGDGIFIAGRTVHAPVLLGTHDAGLSPYFTAAKPYNSFGANSAVVFRGSYEFAPSFSIRDNSAGAATLSISDQAFARVRGLINSGSSSKPTVLIRASVSNGLSYGFGTYVFEGDVRASPTGINPAIRLDADSGWDGIPGRLILEGHFDNETTTDNGGVSSCFAGLGKPSCFVAVSGATRSGKQQWQSSSLTATRFEDTQPGVVRTVNQSIHEIAVAGTTVLGECILDPLGSGPSIGTCDATAQIAVAKPTLLGLLELELLDDAGANDCEVVLQQTIHPGLATWSDGAIAAADCTANDAPHPCCSGSGSGNCKGNPISWLELEYGETGGLFGQESDQLGEADVVSSQTFLMPGQSYRWKIAERKQCLGGARAGRQCDANGDCPSSTCATVGTCTDLNRVRLRWQEYPAIPEPECYDGIDNDSDGTVDWATSGGDADCATRVDDDESS